MKRKSIVLFADLCSFSRLLVRTGANFHVAVALGEKLLSAKGAGELDARFATAAFSRVSHALLAAPDFALQLTNARRAMSDTRQSSLEGSLGILDHVLEGLALPAESDTMLRTIYKTSESVRRGALSILYFPS